MHTKLAHHVLVARHIQDACDTNFGHAENPLPYCGAVSTI
jgi:hypothetical protein